jgi:hypothetical protein
LAKILISFNFSKIFSSDFFSCSKKFLIFFSKNSDFFSGEEKFFLFKKFLNSRFLRFLSTSLLLNLSRFVFWIGVISFFQVNFSFTVLIVLFGTA